MKSVNTHYEKARNELENLLFKNNDIVRHAGGKVLVKESLWLMSFKSISVRDLNRVLQIFFVREGITDLSTTMQGHHITETLSKDHKNEFKGLINYHWGDIPVAIILRADATIGHLRACIACCDKSDEVSNVRDALRHEYGYTRLNEMFKESLGADYV